MKNLGITRGDNLYRRYLLPSIEYENMGDGINYLCLVWWKWFFGLCWETESR